MRSARISPLKGVILRNFDIASHKGTDLWNAQILKMLSEHFINGVRSINGSSIAGGNGRSICCLQQTNADYCSSRSSYTSNRVTRDYPSFAKNGITRTDFWEWISVRQFSRFPRKKWKRNQNVDTKSKSPQKIQKRNEDPVKLPSEISVAKLATLLGEFLFQF